MKLSFLIVPEFLFLKLVQFGFTFTKLPFLEKACITQDAHEQVVSNQINTNICISCSKHITYISTLLKEIVSNKTHYTEKKRVFMIHVSTNDYIIKHATHTIPSLLKCVQLGYNI